MVRIQNLIGAAVLIACLAPAVHAQAPSMDARVTLNIVEQDLSTVVQFLRERSGANIVILQGGDAKVLDLMLDDVHWRDALEYAAALAKCVVDEDKSGVLTIDKPPVVNFEFADTDINKIITTIAKVADANIIVSPEVGGTLSVRLKDVPWRNALVEVCKTRGYVVVEEKRGILRVVDPISLETQQVTKSYQLRYLRPDGNYVPVIKSEFIDGKTPLPTGKAAENFTVLNSLEKALGSNGQLDYIDGPNVLIVRDTVQVHEQIQEILRRLDVEPAQVFVDVKFVSTTNIDVLSLGVDYGDEGPSATLSGGQIPVAFPFNVGSGGFEDGLIANVDGSGDTVGPFTDPFLNQSATVLPDTIFGALSFLDAQATLRLLQRDTKSEVIQAPKIITLDGMEATIFVGETIRYAEAKSEQGQAGGLQLSVEEAQGSPVEVGFQLLVRPYVIPGTERVHMEVIPKETSLSGVVKNSALAPPGFDIFTVGAAGLEGTIALPRTRSSTLVTNMMVESGQTAVIGGLTTDVESTVKSRIPYISRIPILGELFQHTNETFDRRSLVIFITPTLVRNSQDTEFLLQKELARRHTILKDEMAELAAQYSVDYPDAEVSEDAGEEEAAPEMPEEIEIGGEEEN